MTSGFDSPFSRSARTHTPMTQKNLPCPKAEALADEDEHDTAHTADQPINADDGSAYMSLADVLGAPCKPNRVVARGIASGFYNARRHNPRPCTRR